MASERRWPCGAELRDWRWERSMGWKEEGPAVVAVHGWYGGGAGGCAAFEEGSAFFFLFEFFVLVLREEVLH